MSNLGRFFFQKEKQQLTCSHRTSSVCLASPGCVFVGTSVECCEHPSPAAWRGPPISFHQDAMKQGTRKIIFIFPMNRSALVYIGDICFSCIFYLLLRFLYWPLRTEAFHQQRERKQPLRTREVTHHETTLKNMNLTLMLVLLTATKVRWNSQLAALAPPAFKERS